MKKIDVFKLCTTTGLQIINLGYMALWKSVLSYEKVFYLIESFRSGKRLLIVLKHKSFSKCATNAGIHQNFLSNIPWFEWAKEK